MAVNVRGPRDAALAGRRVHAYRVRRGSRRGERVASLRLRRAGRGRARGRAIFRPRRLRRTDRFFICLVERSDDGFGRFVPAAARLCGRRRARL